jgi:hypothetical protein
MYCVGAGSQRHGLAATDHVHSQIRMAVTSLQSHTGSPVNRRVGHLVAASTCRATVQRHAVSMEPIVVFSRRGDIRQRMAASTQSCVDARVTPAFVVVDGPACDGWLPQAWGVEGLLVRSASRRDPAGVVLSGLARAGHENRGALHDARRLPVLPRRRRRAPRQPPSGQARTSPARPVRSTQRATSAATGSAGTSGTKRSPGAS